MIKIEKNILSPPLRGLNLQGSLFSLKKEHVLKHKMSKKNLAKTIFADLFSYFFGFLKPWAKVRLRTRCESRAADCSSPVNTSPRRRCSSHPGTGTSATWHTTIKIEQLIVPAPRIHLHVRGARVTQELELLQHDTPLIKSVLWIRNPVGSASFWRNRIRIGIQGLLVNLNIVSQI